MFRKKIYYLTCFRQQLVFENVIVSFCRQFFLAVFLQRNNAPNFPVNSHFCIFYTKCFLLDKFLICLSTQFLFCPGVLIFSAINVFTISCTSKLKCSKHECISFVSNSFLDFCSSISVRKFSFSFDSRFFSKFQFWWRVFFLSCCVPIATLGTVRV